MLGGFIVLCLHMILIDSLIKYHDLKCVHSRTLVPSTFANLYRNYKHKAGTEVTMQRKLSFMLEKAFKARPGGLAV